MGNDEMDLNEVFGIEETETAEETEETKEKNTETTEEAQNNGETTGEADRGADLEDIPDSVWAKARRRAEAEANARAEKIAQSKIDAFFAEKANGIVNPATGKPVTTKAEFDEAYAAMQLQKAGVKPDMLNDLIAQNPIIKQATEVVQQEKQRQAEAFGTAEIAKLKKQYDLPEVKSVDDLANMENGKAIINLWAKGVPLDKAYAVFNAAQIGESKAAAAQQAALNKVNSKAHLKTTPTTGKEDYPVSDEELERVRQMIPNATREDVKKFRASQKG